MLVTGATGFDGQALVELWVDAKCTVTALVREPSSILPEEVL